jgi:hypothetical protein
MKGESSLANKNEVYGHGSGTRVIKKEVNPSLIEDNGNL